MAAIENLVYFIDQYWDDIGDPRVNHWPLIRGGIWKPLVIIAAYLLIIKLVLPAYMKNRSPYKLTAVMLFYNTFMVICNSFLFFTTIYAMNFGKILLDFDYPSREDRSPETMWFMKISWFGAFTRLIDLLDTVFMALRKKERQISFLHLYHHSVVPLLCWISFKNNIMIPIIRLFSLFNTGIHTLMYGYYALSSLGPSVRSYLWWKRHLTLLQIFQFLISGIYGVVLYIKQTYYPMDWFFCCVGQTPLFLYLFYNFYKQTYIKKKLKNKL